MGKNKTTNKTQKQITKKACLSPNLYTIYMLSQKFPNALKRHILATDRWKADNISSANYQKEPFLFQSHFPLPCCALSAWPVPMSAALESWALPRLPSQVQAGHASSCSPGSTEMFDPQQQETRRALSERKWEIKTHSLLCHWVSSVSKYCSLHLNLIGISLGSTIIIYCSSLPTSKCQLA